MNAPGRHVPDGPPTGPARRQRRQAGGKPRSDAQPLVAVPNLGEEHGDQLADRVAGLEPQELDWVRAVLADAGIRTVLCNVRTPRMHAIAERWIGGCRSAYNPFPSSADPLGGEPGRERVAALAGP